MDWVNDAHRGMRLRPTEEAVSSRELRDGTYTFCSWVTRGQVAEVERLGTKKRKNIHARHLRLA